MDEQLDQELSFHFDQLVKESIEAGRSEEEARLEAMRTLGNSAVLKEECRDQRRVGWLHDFHQDLRYGLRMMRNHPGLTAIAALSLAFAIGANAAIFSVGKSILYGELPLPEADRLVTIGTFQTANPAGAGPVAVPEYMAWKERSRTFEWVGASIANRQDVTPEDDGAPPERLVGQAVSPSLFPALNVQPHLGRVFREDEAQVGIAPAPVIILSHGLWQRRFGGAADIIGREMRLGGRQVTIIGVMPAGFWYPNQESEYWVPLGLTRYQLEGSARLFLVTARLKRGMTLEQAQADVDAIAEQLAVKFPDRYRDWAARVVPLREHWLGWSRQPILMLGAGVIVVFLIACANVSTLLLGRVPARRPEIAMRVLMGAGRGRILRQFLAESLLLSFVGGVPGLLVAWWGVRALDSIDAPFGRIPISVISDGSGIAGFTFLLSAVSSLLFGILPSVAALSPGDPLRQVSIHRRHGRASGILVSFQIGLALMLLVASGLLMNSFVRLVFDDRGFDPTGVLTFQYRIPALEYGWPSGSYHGFPAMRAKPPIQSLQRVYERLQMLPGIESVAASSSPPVNGVVLPRVTLHVEGRPAPTGTSERALASATYFLVTENFFGTMKTPLVVGRNFDARDSSSAPWVAVVNETLARRFWPDEDPIGKRFTVDAVSGERVREVIGVIRDVPLQYVRTGPAEAVAYTLYRQQPENYEGLNAGMFGQMTVFVRSDQDPMTLSSAARVAVAEVDPDHPPAEFRTMTELVGATMRPRRFYVSALGMFAFMATVLAAVGVYGVMSMVVSQRTREIGIRMAIGARPRHIIAAIGAPALRWVLTGILFGLAGSLLLTNLARAQLWGVTATDPATLISVTAILVVVSAVACFIPARRAMRVDANVSLRTGE